LLDQYARAFDQGAPDASLLEAAAKAAAQTTDPEVFRAIAGQLWDRYYVVDVDTMIGVLRRWLEVEPRSAEAKRALGSYLLAHGPDWDEEGRGLLAEAREQAAPD
jgi:hypothetical protein